MITLTNCSTSELKTVAGTVTEIERYAIHDGYGIRSTVFLKGCPLACAWCSNPETQKRYPELGLFDDKCIGCGACVKACPHGAIAAGANGLETNRERCRTHCYLQEDPFPCVQGCYAGARVALGQRRTAGDVYQELARDRAFFDSSNGGITLSGGEPLMQPDFAYALLRLCKEKWINTAIETCGAGEPEDYEALMPWLDMVFIDVKSLNREKYREWVGVEPERQAESLRLLARLCNQSGTRMIARTPVIPGFNDSEEDIRAIAEFLAQHQVQGAELLPYHKLGRSKYTAVGRTYALKDLIPPRDEQMARLNAILEEYGVPVYHF